jgi:ATP-binding cassette, subfamily F, member 3
VTTITWELSLGRLTVYRGNYSHYLVEKAQRLELERAAYDNQQAQIRQSERFITRFRAKSTKSRQVQSRVKQLEKLDRIELSETERVHPFHLSAGRALGPRCAHPGGCAQELSTAGRCSTGSAFSLQRGDKLAVVGVNGAGKTTLLKILAGLEPAEGRSSRATMSSFPISASTRPRNWPAT